MVIIMGVVMGLQNGSAVNNNDNIDNFGKMGRLD